MFILDGVELVCLVCRGELDIVQGNELFGVEKDLGLLTSYWFLN